MLKKPKKSNAFTLIELIITLSIIAIIVNFSTQGVGQILAKVKLNSAKSQLINSLQLARATSIFQKTNAIVCPSSDGKKCDQGKKWSLGWILFADTNKNNQRDSTEVILLIRSRLKSIQITSSVNRNKAIFNRSGTVFSNMRLRLCISSNPNLGSEIIISTNGRIRNRKINC